MTAATIKVHGTTITNDEVWLCRVYYPATPSEVLSPRIFRPARPAYTRTELLRAKVTEAYTYSDGEHEPATIEWQCFGSEISVNDWPDETSKWVQPLIKIEIPEISVTDHPLPDTWSF